tara:strand:+ start:1894 stop:2688 length:795 start_codon:yes stop_codon:yes gene_type:complete
MARSTLIQGGPAFFTPEGYTPPIQPEQAFMPTDVMRDPIADMFAAQPPLTRGPSLPKPPIPPREDQIFIDDMPPMREEPPMDFPMPMPEPMPEPMLDPMPQTPVNIPNFNDIDMDAIRQRIADLGIGLPQEPLPPIDMPPMMPPMKELPPRREDFMSIDRMSKPRDEFIPRMINEDPVSFIPPSTPMPMPKLSPLQQAFEKIQNQQMPMPMQPRMPMPGPIATPTPKAPMPMAPINLPRLELPETNRMDRQIPMMPRIGGMGRR